ncbi:MAG: cell division protein FtsL, partial [Actinobacteria bacterium]|nr:cell division protein FtsL [Actinomycetota bacterium]
RQPVPRQPASRPPVRPDLRILPEPPSVRARRLSRLITALAGVAVCFGLFAVVGVHVLLAQGQGEVERLSSEVAEQEQQQQRLRLEVAELESPSRVVAAARERLGMVTPSTLVSLAPASLDDPPASGAPAP